jgi:ketosteroid isomerase-like protein
MRKVFSVVGTVGVFVLAAATAFADIRGRAESDRDQIEAAVRSSIGWALTKDRPLLESLLAQDDGLFIFHPDSKSTVRGWAEFVKLFEVWMDPRFKATRFDVRDLRITLSRSGDAAWYSALLDDCGEWDGKASCWKDTRWTGVLEKREGRWVIVQMHFSFAADKVREEALPKEKNCPRRPDRDIRPSRLVPRVD